jgi:primary-amine oxidase
MQRTRYRPDLKPVQIVQPEGELNEGIKADRNLGVSFKVEGWKVSWQNWSFRIGFNTWDGLVLRLINYNDNGRERPIVYRARYVTHLLLKYPIFSPFYGNPLP